MPEMVIDVCPRQAGHREPLFTVNEQPNYGVSKRYGVVGDDAMLTGYDRQTLRAK